jgi:hypothetical protein
LRLDYRNQPLGEALDIAMEPVATYGGEPTILTLVNWGTGLLLIGRDGRPDGVPEISLRVRSADQRTSGGSESSSDCPDICRMTSNSTSAGSDLRQELLTP